MDEVFMVVSEDDSGGVSHVEAVFLDQDQAEQHAEERTRAGLPCRVLVEHLWDANGGPERRDFFMARLALDDFGELVKFAMNGRPRWERMPDFDREAPNLHLRARRNAEGWTLQGSGTDPFSLLAALHDLRDAIQRGEDVAGDYE